MLQCMPRFMCSNADCRTKPLWEKLNTIVNEYLDSKTLADLIKKDV